MSILAHLTVQPPGGRRGSRRRRIRLEAGRVDAGAGAQDIVIHDLSRGGCSFASRYPIAPGTLIRLLIPHAGEVRARASWVDDTQVGCAFEPPLAPDALAAALANSPVIWGDFTPDETVAPKPAVASSALARPRWPVWMALAVLLAAFWYGVAAVV